MTLFSGFNAAERLLLADPTASSSGFPTTGPLTSPGRPDIPRPIPNITPKEAA